MGPVLQARLDERIETLTAGGHYVALFVTFTLDPSRFESPLDAWKFAQRNRVVSRAVKSQSRSVGYNCTGLWFAKLELHKSGWPHWHLIVLVPAASVDSAERPLREWFNDHWKYGFSKTLPCPQSGEYFTKVASYSCKDAGNSRDGDAALRASGLPATRVRWISASPGFWGTESDDDDDVERECAQALLWDDEIPFDDAFKGETPDALHADRVEWCRRNAFLEFESADGVLPVQFNLSRKALAEYVVERAPAIRSVDRYEESGVVRSFVSDDVDAFLDFLEDEFCPNILRLDDLDRLRRFLRRPGFWPDLEPSSPLMKASAAP